MTIPTITKDEYDRYAKRHAAVFEFQKKPCPRCGSELIKTRACTGLVKDGFKSMLRCPKVMCGFTEGLEKDEGGQEK